MIDSGAFTNLFPPTKAQRFPGPVDYHVQAANGTLITCYEITNMTISLGERKFHHHITIADSIFSMLGLDFLERKLTRH